MPPDAGARHRLNTLPLRVLVAEDHAPLREQIVALLPRRGHRTDEASSGRLALQFALVQPPDVLLDIGLPELDGLDLCRRLRQQCKRHVPVLMPTTRATLAERARHAAGQARRFCSAAAACGRQRRRSL
ncbi:MAG: response regulator [Rubrivivax sp.]|nr:response regulator [Rubrivivax sp.]